MATTVDFVHAYTAVNNSGLNIYKHWHLLLIFVILHVRGDDILKYVERQRNCQL